MARKKLIQTPSHHEITFSVFSWSFYPEKSGFVLKTKNTSYTHTCPHWCILAPLASSLHIEEKVKACAKTSAKNGTSGFWSCGHKWSQRHLTKGMEKDAKRQEVNERKAMTAHASSWASMEQQTFPLLVNCCDIHRRVCLPLINPFLNYRAEGKCGTVSARMSPNEPPPFLSAELSPSSHFTHRLPFSPHLCLPLLFHASANQILSKL